MSYRKKRNYKKRPYRRYRRRTPMYRKLAMIPYPEKKYHDIVVTRTPSDAGSRDELTNINQGSSNEQRIGHSLKFVSMLLNLNAKVDPASSGTTVRYNVVLDKQPNGATPAINDIWETSDVISAMNKSNGKRFRILCGGRIDLSPTGDQIKTLSIWKDFKFGDTKYKGNTGTITDLSTNSLLLVLVSNETVNTPLVEVCCRLRYVDS